MKFILTIALCGVSLSTVDLHAADAAPTSFPPNAAHTNVTRYALAQAEQAPFGSDPMRLVRGEGTWQNAGPDPRTMDKTKIDRFPVNEAYPSWFVLVWPETIPLSALRLRTNADQVKFYLFTGGDAENPGLAPGSSWERVWTSGSPGKGKDQNESVHEVTFPAGAKARAVKIRLMEVRPRNSKVASISELSVWGQPPAKPFETLSDVSPVAIPCRYAVAGEAALVVEDASGRRVRNLIAQVERKEGDAEPWDLKDEDGQYVAPGTYRCRWTIGPKPELIYQMTPYPNVENHSPESTPWNRGPADGWLANHADNSGACVIGDKLYMCAGPTEGGHNLIECDLQGRKAWGQSSFISDGLARVFTDGTTLFVWSCAASAGGFSLVGGRVSRMDPATHKITAAVNLDQGGTRKGAVVGLAARENRVYAAYYARLPPFEMAARDDQVDLGACLPKLPAKVKSSGYYGAPIWPQRDFLSFLRMDCEGVYRHPGYFVAGDARNTLYLESTKGSGPRQRVLVAFREPVALGSLVFPRPELKDLEFKVSVLKPDAPWPPKPSREGDWLPISLPKLTAWNCLPLPEKLKTRALCLTFSKPGDDLLGEEDEIDPKLEGGLDLAGGGSAAGGTGNAWSGRLEGMRLLRARFENVAPAARVRVSSGAFDLETGEWDAQRKEALSEEDPGVFLMEWDQPQTLSGLALKEVDGEVTKIDVFSGSGAPDLVGMDGWETVAEYRQHPRNFYQSFNTRNNAEALYLDGTVDFGKDVTTKAVRLRVVKQWSDDQTRGRRKDRGGTAVLPASCRIYGVAALRPLGGEVPLDPLTYQWLAVFDGTSGKLLSEKPSVITGGIEFRHKDGALFGFVGSQFMRIGDDPAKPTPFITDVKKPGWLSPVAFDPAGNCYVWDQADDRRQVRVYDEGGKYLRSIGTPGPRKPGPYDATVIDEASALAASGKGDLYAVYPHDNPRRVAHFRQDGAFVQDFLGNTTYGGGGTLDPHDKSRLYYQDLRFDLDWETGKTRLDSVMSSKGREEASPFGSKIIRRDVEAIVVDGRRYLVSVPLNYVDQSPFQVVCAYDEQARKLRLAAAVGDAGRFPYLQQPEVLKATGGKPLGGFTFTWADRNGDGEVQAAETVLTPKQKNEQMRVGRADAKLGFWAGPVRSDGFWVGAARYEVKEFLTDGTPVYELRPMPFEAGYHMPNGNHFRFGWRNGVGVNEVVDSQGRSLWFYKASHGMDGLYVPPWQPGRVDLQFGIAGFGKVQGDLGDIFVIAANNGQWNLWTADGLLAGHLTLHTRDPRLKGWPAEHARGTKMENITAAQETFHYFFTQTADGKFYVVMGAMWISVMEVQGLERIRRGEAQFTVTPEMIQKAQVWEASRLQRSLFTKSAVQECPRGAPVLDGQLSDDEWPVSTLIDDWARFAMQQNGDRLFLGWSVEKRGAFTNGGDDFRRTFKTGAAVDLQLGTRAEADPNRKAPVAGDIRLLVTRVEGKPVAVLYRPVAPDAPKSDRWETRTPAGGTAAFDQVKILDAAVIAVQEAADRYSVEASIPLKDLGLAPEPGQMFKMDWGVLTTADGFVTSSRTYWANPMATGVSDEPTEARLQPGLWGHVRFAASADERGLPGMLEPSGQPSALDDLLE